MGDFSNLNMISQLSDIYEKIDLNSDTINLNSNLIKNAQLEILPDNVINIYLDDNYIEELSWDTRNWGIISLKNNNFDTKEFSELTCKELLLDDNQIENITFSNCNFDILSISNNNIKTINFFDCVIKELNLSVNKITEIITLPSGLVKLNCYGNKINNIFIHEFNFTLKWIDLSDNKLESIQKLPDGLLHLDLSKNKFKTFDTSILPINLNYFDITENNITCNKKLFGELSSHKLFYDTDEEDKISNKNTDNNNDVETDSDTETDSDMSSDISIKLNKKFTSFKNNYLELNESDGDKNDNIIDEDVARYINEYKNNNSSNDILSFSNSSSPFDSDFLNGINISNNDFIDKNNNLDSTKVENAKSESDNTNLELSEFINQNQILTKRDIMLKAAITRFREENNDHMKKNFSKTFPISLQWNFNL